MKRLTRRAEADGVKAVWFGNRDVFLEGEVGYAEADKLAHYEDLQEAGRLLELPCKKGDTVWELCKCSDGEYRIFPMVVCTIVPFGSPRWSKNNGIESWNIYAEGDYCKMYKSFYDFGRTVFLTREEAEAALKGGGQE